MGFFFSSPLSVSLDVSVLLFSSLFCFLSVLLLQSQLRNIVRANVCVKKLCEGRDSERGLKWDLMKGEREMEKKRRQMESG